MQKELAIVSVLLGDNIDVEANQDIASIYRYLHGDWYFPFGSWKSGNKIIVDFGWNVDDKIVMNPLSTIVIPLPQLTSNSLSNCEIFNLVGSGSLWHITMKSLI